MVSRSFSFCTAFSCVGGHSDYYPAQHMCPLLVCCRDLRGGVCFVWTSPRHLPIGIITYCVNESAVFRQCWRVDVCISSIQLSSPESGPPLTCLMFLPSAVFFSCIHLLAHRPIYLPACLPACLSVFVSNPRLLFVCCTPLWLSTSDLSLWLVCLLIVVHRRGSGGQNVQGECVPQNYS